MDHIPNTVRPVNGHIRVPYLFREEWDFKYDNKGFFFFPERKEWDSGAILRRDFIQNRDRGRAASFLQEWLYFGFMSEVLGIEVLTEHFTEEDEVGGQRFITTASLPKYIDDWQMDIAWDTPDAKEKRFQNLLRLFRDADMYFRVVTQSPEGEPPTPLSPELQLSFSILHATLVFARMHIFRNVDDPSPHNTAEFISGIPVEYAKSLLRAQHWCPSDIALLEQGGLGLVSSLELYYAYLLGDRKIIRDHSACESSFAGQFACAALDIGDEDYEPTHVIGCQRNCGLLEVDQDWVARVCQAGALPLITISVNDRGSASLEKHQGDSTTTYVAISHVYADGLGNPHQCGLPACQLKQLQSRVNVLNHPGLVADAGSGNVVFWMDTLCIPVRDDLDRVRKVAIRSMADIYTRAQAVLVLNAELGYHSCHVSREELLMRISTSAWFRRLWTLQEGVLANNLYFQFQDGAVNIESLGPSQEEDYERRFSVLRRLQAQAIKPYERIRAFRELPREQRIREVYPLLQWRTTSKAEDEPYCLATLLLADKDVIHKITATKDIRKRREEFILGQSSFPVKSLFFCEPRVGTRAPPIGWALRTYLRRLEAEAVPAGDPLAPVDMEGLHVNLSGIIIAASELPANPVNGNQFPKVNFVDENQALRLEVSSFFWLRDQSPPQSWADICAAFGASQLGILFEQSPLVSQIQYTNWKSSSTIRGAIVAVTEETHNKFAGFFCGTAVISKSPEPIRRTTDNEGFDESILTSSLLLGDMESEVQEILKAVEKDMQSNALLTNLLSEIPSLQTSLHPPEDGLLRENKGVVFGRYIEDAQEWCIK